MKTSRIILLVGKSVHKAFLSKLIFDDSLKLKKVALSFDFTVFGKYTCFYVAYDKATGDVKHVIFYTPHGSRFLYGCTAREALYADFVWNVTAAMASIPIVSAAHFLNMKELIGETEKRAATLRSEGFRDLGIAREKARVINRIRGFPGLAEGRATQRAQNFPGLAKGLVTQRRRGWLAQARGRATQRKRGFPNLAKGRETQRAQNYPNLAKARAILRALGFPNAVKGGEASRARRERRLMGPVKDRDTHFPRRLPGIVRAQAALRERGNPQVRKCNEANRAKQKSRTKFKLSELLNSKEVKYLLTHEAADLTRERCGEICDEFAEIYGFPKWASFTRWQKNSYKKRLINSHAEFTLYKESPEAVEQLDTSHRVLFFNRCAVWRDKKTPFGMPMEDGEESRFTIHGFHYSIGIFWHKAITDRQERKVFVEYLRVVSVLRYDILEHV